MRATGLSLQLEWCIPCPHAWRVLALILILASWEEAEYGWSDQLLPPTWEAWIDFLAPSFGLVELWLLRAFEVGGLAHGRSACLLFR